MLALAVVVGFAAVVAPWAVRNTRLQKVPVLVDTMGGMNLRMGNYEFTPHDRIWDAVSMEGRQSWIQGLPPEPPGGGEWTEGQKERWARDRAVAFMRSHPGLTLWRAAIKFGDFWGLDRDFVAGVERGMYRPPTWVTVVVGGAMLVAYPLTLFAALAGIVRGPSRRSPRTTRSCSCSSSSCVHCTRWSSVTRGTALPLMPILMIYAAAAITHRARSTR